jgi:hypothetical protein
MVAGGRRVAGWGRGRVVLRGAELVASTAMVVVVVVVGVGAGAGEDVVVRADVMVLAGGMVSGAVPAAEP